MRVIAEVRYADQCTTFTTIENPVIQYCEQCQTILFAFYKPFEKCPHCSTKLEGE